MIFTLPTLQGFGATNFGLLSNTLVHESPLTQSAQTRELPGAVWFGSYSLPPMIPDKAAAWRSFLVQMRGRAGRVYGFDPDHKAPRGAAGGVPVVNGGGQTGFQLAIRGASASVPGWLLPGDYFAFNTAVGRELKIVTQSADTDVNGDAMLTFEPPIRNAPVDGTQLILQEASCVMRLDEDAVVWSGDTSSYISLSFNLVEVFF